MARSARVVAVDVAHHVTQRRNARQVILSSDGDRVAYIELLRQALQEFCGKIIMFPHREKTMVPLPSVPAFPAFPAFPTRLGSPHQRKSKAGSSPGLAPDSE